jgi:hypothetical protein
MVALATALIPLVYQGIPGTYGMGEEYEDEKRK